ncbi:methylated-DNA--[protein]-cysteine S-methyltransferase [Limisphaera sp. VF-2]|mgnify:CR=1 FL=1|jgi:methylated-DNA-[protein]-cysteine S-methyltransferase|uniref:methylated-DNA--[protein]-cysteine S-methyltransferase n=1 Tax=Limisphaera sp. VF-2 TaxID=3400418 RepID=UPI001761F73B
MKTSRTADSSNPPFWELPVVTEQGVFRARYSPSGLARLEFPKGRVSSPAPDVRRIPEQVRRWHGQTVSAVRAVLQGKRPRGLPPLDWTGHPVFHQRVWQALQAIPRGEVRTYGQVARALGKPGAARAVGQACAANPIPLLVPCHRVVRAGGGLGGFSAGPVWKQLLLAMEGVPGAVPGPS